MQTNASRGGIIYLSKTGIIILCLPVGRLVYYADINLVDPVPQQSKRIQSILTTPPITSAGLKRSLSIKRAVPSSTLK